MDILSPNAFTGTFSCLSKEKNNLKVTQILSKQRRENFLTYSVRLYDLVLHSLEEGLHEQTSQEKKAAGRYLS